jgi:hypothetical protein
MDFVLVHLLKFIYHIVSYFIRFVEAFCCGLWAVSYGLRSGLILEIYLSKHYYLVCFDRAHCPMLIAHYTKPKATPTEGSSPGSSMLPLLPENLPLPRL